MAWAAVNERRVWAKAELDDFIGIDLTWVRAEVDFYDDGSDVWGGHNRLNLCSWLHDGWYNTSCTAAYWNNGPNYVYNSDERLLCPLLHFAVRS